MTKTMSIPTPKPEELEKLMKESIEAFEKMSLEDQERMLQLQRMSWVRGNLAIDKDETPSATFNRVFNETRDFDKAYEAAVPQSAREVFNPPLPDNGALRHNSGKLRYDLIPPEFLSALAKLMTDNLGKYPERNWERGMDWQKCFASLMRHAWAWEGGEDLDHDPVTGDHFHILMAAWNCMALYVYQVRNIGRDDRPNQTKKESLP